MAPVISRSNLQQSGSSPTPLAAQITVVGGGPIDNEHLDAEGAKILRGAMQEAFGRL